MPAPVSSAAASRHERSIVPFLLSWPAARWFPAGRPRMRSPLPPTRHGSHRHARSRVPCARPAVRRSPPRSLRHLRRRRGTRLPASACNSPITAPAARSPQAASKSPASAPVRQRMHRRQRERRVQIVAQRLHHRRRHIDGGDVRIALQRAIEPIQLAPRLRHRRIGEVRRRAVVRADQQQPHRLARHLRQHVAQGEEVAGLFDIFSPFTSSMPLCTQ